jgi:hypothetical protein
MTSNLLEAFPLLRKHLESLDESGGHTEQIDPSSPEQYSLPLPSRFNQATRTACQLDSAARFEYELRQGQAYDALEDVRINILSWQLNSQIRMDEFHGQHAKTRIGAFLRGLLRETRCAARLYIHARHALLQLGLSPKSQTFQPLDIDRDLWVKDPAKPRRTGDTKVDDPWYWTECMPDNLSDQERSEWVTECKWTRS